MENKIKLMILITLIIGATFINGHCTNDTNNYIDNNNIYPFNEPLLYVQNSQSISIGYMYFVTNTSISKPYFTN